MKTPKQNFLASLSTTNKHTFFNSTLTYEGKTTHIIVSKTIEEQDPLSL